MRKFLGVAILVLTFTGITGTTASAATPREKAQAATIIKLTKANKKLTATTKAQATVITGLQGELTGAQGELAKTRTERDAEKAAKDQVNASLTTCQSGVVGAISTMTPKQLWYDFRILSVILSRFPTSGSMSGSFTYVPGAGAAYSFYSIY
jgi:hypothetical protein